MLGNLKNLIVRAVRETQRKISTIIFSSNIFRILETFSGLKYEAVSWNVFNVTLIKSTAKLAEEPNKT